MHRPGADPANMAPEDFLCDFCAAHWTPDRPMVEGHHGSLICGACLHLAYGFIVGLEGDQRRADDQCTMCLERRDESFWRSDARPEASICRRCVKQAATRLEKDPESGWRRHGEGGEEGEVKREKGAGGESTPSSAPSAPPR